MPDVSGAIFKLLPKKLFLRVEMQFYSRMDSNESSDADVSCLHAYQSTYCFSQRDSCTPSHFKTRIS